MTYREDLDVLITPLNTRGAADEGGRHTRIHTDALGAN